MRRLASLIAVVVGCVLLYLGCERQHSIAGHADSVVSRVNRDLDGGGRPATHVVYYAGGALLVACGIAGLCAARD